MPSDEDAWRVKRAHEEALLALDTRVLGVGLGGKVEGGRPTGELAIWVIAHDEQMPGQAAIRDLIPPNYEGVKTHIVDVTTAQPDQFSKLATAGGYIRTLGSIKEVDADGTFGIAARTLDVPHDKRPNVLLSCRHVLFSSGPDPENPKQERDYAQVGDRVVSLSCSGCCKPHVARVLRGDPLVDAAIATIDDDWDVEEGRIDNVVLAGLAHIDPTKSWSSVPSDIATALKWMRYEVHKCGAKTGWTKGLVGCVDIRFGPGYGPRGQEGFARHILIAPTGKDQMFATHGDSGAVVIDAQRRIVALLHSGAATPDDTRLTWAVPIGFVEHLLKIKVAVGSPPSIWGAVAPSALAQAHSTLAAADAGRDLLDLYGRHEREVRNLMRENRRFRLAWHRNGGPEMVQALVAVAERKAAALPTEIAGRSWEDRARAVVHALREFGSPALVRDADRFEPFLAGLGGCTFGQLMDMVQHLRAQSATGTEPFGATR